MKKSVSSVIPLLLGLSVFMVAFLYVPSVAAQDKIYIREDGSVEGTNSIHQDGDVYTLLGNIFDKGLVVEKSDIVIDGNGHTVSTPPAVDGYNIVLTQLNNVTIRGLVIKDGYIGIFIEDCTRVTVSGNNVSIGDPNFFYIAAAIRLEGGGFHTIIDNTITDSQVGIWITESSHNNKIYHNNFLNNKYSVFGAEEATSVTQWDNGYPSGGNHWDNYDGVDIYSGVYQNETGSDGISDTPYIFVVENETLFADKYPLMETVPVIPEFQPWMIVPLFAVSTGFLLFVKKRKFGTSRND
jgi:parallel beta-helix repeat protein